MRLSIAIAAGLILAGPAVRSGLFAPAGRIHPLRLLGHPYQPAERFAAGDYVFPSKGGDGLPAWSSRGRSITDLVVWHTVGMHHLPRAEDIPVMPTLWSGFKLRPFAFFDRNPALDLRTDFAAQPR